MGEGARKTKARTAPALVQRFAPAKVNLTLRVVGRRPDGYHLIESVLVPLTLGDLVEVEFGGRGIRLSCSDPALPAGEENLAWRAARAFLGATGIRRGVRIGLGKAIPVAAGLGGGSSDAAAVLRGLNDLSARPLAPKALHRIATGLGADVPFFLDPRPSVAAGIGEILRPMPPLPVMWFVLVNPGLEIAAAWAYVRLGGALTSPGPQHKVRRFSSHWSDIGACLSNDLEAAILPRFPVLVTLKERLIGLGAVGALVSGSGPTVFGLFREESAARHAATSLRRAASWRIFLARSL